MEARGESQHRAQVNPRKAGLPGQACRFSRRPVSNRGRLVVGAAAARSYPCLPQEISLGPETVEPKEVFNAGSMPEEKSDRLVGAMKPVKVGRAKGTTGFEV